MLCFALTHCLTPWLFAQASKRKRGEQVYASDAWRELILAQAFKPPSWLGEDADAFEHSEEALVSYEVEILTGTVSGAGTKAKVFIDLEGAEGGRPRRSGRRVLNTPGQPFDKGKIARFTFDCTALGELKNMKIGHDDSGFSANWFCEKVTIKRANSAQQWEISVGKVLRTELPLPLSPFPLKDARMSIKSVALFSNSGSTRRRATA